MFFVSTTVHGQDADHVGSPFEKLRWNDGVPQVMVRSVWYRAESIHGVDVSEILAFCEQRWPGLKQKRFGEDLVEALERMGHAVPSHVNLTLTRLSDGERVELRGVEVSARNRNAIRDASRRAKPRRPEEAPPPSELDRAQALADIAEFQRRVDDQFAYRHWKGIDLDAALDDVRASLGDKVLPTKLASSLERVMARFGDGHARVSAFSAPTRSLYAPFLLGDTSIGAVAFKQDRTGFLHEERPYILAIDGLPIEDWIDAARPEIVDGSPQLIRHRGLRALRDISRLRPRLGLPDSGFVHCTLATSPSDPNPIELGVPMVDRRPLYGSGPGRETGMLANNLGYIRIAQMSRDIVPSIRSAMTQFRQTDGLIVDVRGNGGGTRDALIALAGYFLAPGEQPWIGNVARYRLSDAFSRDHLVARFMYRADDPIWSDAQRAVIASFAETFEPEWSPGIGFSAWHYLVLDHTGCEEEYFYSKPVVILSDPASFSATDIFLGALAGRPRITLLGEASGGGSARSQRFRLSNSQIVVQCASMSYQPNGIMYDGRGIDVVSRSRRVPGIFYPESAAAILCSRLPSITSSLNDPRYTYPEPNTKPNRSGLITSASDRPSTPTIQDA